MQALRGTVPTSSARVEATMPGAGTVSNDIRFTLKSYPLLGLGKGRDLRHGRRRSFDGKCGIEKIPRLPLHLLAEHVR